MQKKLIMAFNEGVSISDDLIIERLKLYHMGQRVYHFHIYNALAQHKITNKTAQTLLKLTIPTFPLKGQDFINLGYSSGPQMKQLIEKTEAIWAQNGFSDNKELVLKQFLMYNK